MNRQHAHKLVSSGRANSFYVSVYATSMHFLKAPSALKMLPSLLSVPPTQPCLSIQQESYLQTCTAALPEPLPTYSIHSKWIIFALSVKLFFILVKRAWIEGAYFIFMWQLPGQHCKCCGTSPGPGPLRTSSRGGTRGARHGRGKAWQHKSSLTGL